MRSRTRAKKQRSYCTTHERNRRRARSFHGRVDVDVQILEASLTEIDGVELNDKVMVFEATNRIHAVEPAIRRPGRYGVYLGRYDSTGN